MRWIIAAIIPGFLLSGAITAADESPATQPSAQAMQARIQSLEARIDDLQTRQVQNQADVTAAIHTFMADADSHSGAAEITEFPNGYDSSYGFVIQSADGDFSLHPSVLVQFRSATAFRQHVPTGGGGIAGSGANNIQSGFEVSRFRFMLDGNVINPNLTYFFQIADDAPMLGTVGVLDAYLMYRISTQSPIAVKAGQFKDPVFHEANLLPSRLMAVDRSLVNQLLGGGQTNRVQGVGMIYDKGRLRDQLDFTDGYNSANTPFFEAGGQGTEVGGGEGITPTNFGISGRAEYLLVGDRAPDFNPFIEYDQFTAMNAKQTILVLGGGFDYSESGRDKILFHTLDAQLDTTFGLGVYAAYLADYREASSPKGAPGGSFYDNGFIIQASYMVTAAIEPFVRYDYTYLNGKSLPGINHDVSHEFTVGANYYFHGQQLKATLDATWLPNGIPTDAANLGYLQDDAHYEVSVRAQMQLAL